jgi:hypothetical protein
LLTRWRTGGRTNFELVREFGRELPHAPATEAWQRACLLAREAPLEASREPRLKRTDETGELPTADHPFFWAGYLLVDTSPGPAEKAEKAEGENGELAKAEEMPPSGEPSQAPPGQSPGNGSAEPPQSATPGDSERKNPADSEADAAPSVSDE